jgi:hypothetical protein
MNAGKARPTAKKDEMNKAGSRVFTSLILMSTPAKSADWVCLFACFFRDEGWHAYNGRGPPAVPVFHSTPVDVARRPSFGGWHAAWQLLDIILSRTRTEREKPAMYGQKLRKMPMSTTGCRVFTSLVVLSVAAKSAVWTCFCAPWSQDFDNAGKSSGEGAA